jgi:4-amino-4-deoxy-L-arabinose transferase-like glycosyltransferase
MSVNPLSWLQEREKGIIILVFLLALALRLSVTFSNPIPSGDGVASNVELARNLDSGYGFSTMRKWTLYDRSMEPLRPEGNRQPVMSLLILTVFAVSGPGFVPAQLLSMVLGLLCMLACWIWARKTFGPLPALLTLLVLTVHPLFIWFSVQPKSLMAFTALFFAILVLADRDELSWRRTTGLGLLAALAYLLRTQGLLLALSLAIWVFVRGGRGRLRKVTLFTAVFLLACAPWFIRNIEAFGSPTHSQNSQFLLNENHYAAWEVRDTVPSPTDMLRYQGPGAVAVYVAKGFLRVLEPVALGTLHRGEVFGQPPLAAFALLAVLALQCVTTRRRMLLPLIATLPVAAVLVLHQHSGRYFAFLVVMVLALGSAGLFRLLESGKRWISVLALAVLLLPFLTPLAAVLTVDTRERAAEAREVSDWLVENSGSGDWVVTYPNVELFIWDYRRPTLTMPNDYEMLLWPCLEDHGVRYVVVDGDLARLRPRLAGRWMMSPDGNGWLTENPPPFLEEVYRSMSGRTIVYEMTGPVPPGFMQVDSLPRDNMRAMPPSG